LDIATIARIEADRIYALILPEMEEQETVTVPLPFLQNVLTTGQKLEGFAPTYVRRALDRLAGTVKIHRFRRSRVSHLSRPRFGSRRIRRRDGFRELVRATSDRRVLIGVRP